MKTAAAISTMQKTTPSGPTDSSANAPACERSSHCSLRDGVAMLVTRPWRDPLRPRNKSLSDMSVFQSFAFVVCVDNALYQRMAHDVLFLKMNEGHAVHVAQNIAKD